MTVTIEKADLQAKVDLINRKHKAELLLIENGTLNALFSGKEHLTTGTNGALMMNLELLDKAFSIGKRLGFQSGYHAGAAETMELAATFSTNGLT